MTALRLAAVVAASLAGLPVAVAAVERDYPRGMIRAADAAMGLPRALHWNTCRQDHVPDRVEIRAVFRSTTACLGWSNPPHDLGLTFQGCEEPVTVSKIGDC
ncbi:hypothetical protein [Allokutzneria sp. NRRL B-24872]|uniref:hypothetical protein n=1 Tax=Allokutzneria sp. NRRL B-24872 TaxID=1137961 RepID=UPI000A3904DF|nr:hypothetical protein [Allokutzneria sp. NRRL B-24872]